MKTRIARHLRRNISDVERLLWHRLRDRQIKGYRFRRQHPFRDYVLDFFCVDAKLVIELNDGKAGDAQHPDDARITALEAAGYQVLRFTNNEMSDIESVLEVVARALPEEIAPRSPRKVEGADDDDDLA